MSVVAVANSSVATNATVGPVRLGSYHQMLLDKYCTSSPMFLFI